MKLLNLFVLTIALVACSAGPSTQSSEINLTKNSGIVDGYEVGANDSMAKRAVLLHVKRTAGGATWSTCTAVPISQTILLTAAHCVDGADAIGVTFGVNEYDTSSCRGLNGCFSWATEYRFHPRYNANDGVPGNFDIGLVKLSQAIPRDYKPTELATEEDVEGRITILGYGRTGEYQPQTAGVLRMTQKNVGDFNLSNGLLIFASSICHGDSGGPVLIKKFLTYKVIGINHAVSGSRDKCREDNYAQYVPAYRQWIINQMIDMDGAR